MRVTLTLVTLLFFFSQSFASSEVPVIPKKANEIYLPIGKNMQISLTDLSYIKVKDYENLTGNHLKFADKIAFKAGQKQLRNNINADGTLSHKMEKAMSDGDHSTGFHIGGFALGFLLGLIGVLFAYIIKTDEEVDKNRKKWAWIGFGLYAVLVVVLLLSIKTPTF